MDERKRGKLNSNPNTNSNLDPVLERILDKLKERGYTAKQLEMHLHLPNGSITKWKIRNGKSYFRYIVEIAEFLGTTSSYLLDGNVMNVGDLTLEEKNLIMYFRKVDKSERGFVAEIVKKFSKNYPTQS